MEEILIEKAFDYIKIINPISSVKGSLLVYTLLRISIFISVPK